MLGLQAATKVVGSQMFAYIAWACKQFNPPHEPNMITHYCVSRPPPLGVICWGCIRFCLQLFAVSVSGSPWQTTWAPRCGTPSGLAEVATNEHELIALANRTMLKGISAGAAAVYYHVDWLQTMLPSTLVFGSPQSGWFGPSFHHLHRFERSPTRSRQPFIHQVIMSCCDRDRPRRVGAAARQDGGAVPQPDARAAAGLGCSGWPTTGRSRSPG